MKWKNEKLVYMACIDLTFSTNDDECLIINENLVSIDSS